MAGNDFTIWDALIPLVGAAAAAYSPRYLGAGVQTGAHLYGTMQAAKQAQQRTNIDQAFRDEQLQEAKDRTEQERFHNRTLLQQEMDKQKAKESAANAFLASNPGEYPGPLPETPPMISGLAEGIRTGGVPFDEAQKTVANALAQPKPEKPPAPEYPFASGSQGIYDKRTGKVTTPSVPKETKPTKPPTPPSGEKPPTRTAVESGLRAARQAFDKAKANGDEAGMQEAQAAIDRWKSYLPNQGTPSTDDYAASLLKAVK